RQWSEPVPLLPALFQPRHKSIEVRARDLQAFGQTLALVAFHSRDEGADATQGSRDVVHVVDEANQFSGSSHNDFCSSGPRSGDDPRIMRSSFGNGKIGT